MFNSVRRHAFSRITLAHHSATGAPAFAGDPHPNHTSTPPFRILTDGTWLFQDDPITQGAMISLFASLLIRDCAGFYQLMMPTGIQTVQVDDAPFLAVEMFSSGGCGVDQVISFLTNVDEIVSLDDDHPIRTDFTDLNGGVPRCYILVRPGLEARLTRPVVDQLCRRGIECSADALTNFGIWSCGKFHTLGCLDEQGEKIRPAS